MAPDELTTRLDEVIEALRMLAGTTPTDPAETIAERAQAVRIAGYAFEQQLGSQCTSHASVFQEPELPWGWNRTEWDEHQDDDSDLPTDVRLSVRFRQDFFVEDEHAFHESATRILAAHGQWPPPDYCDEHRAVYDLAALVDRLGLHEVTVGGSVAGLRNAGGDTDVVIVDREDPDWFR